MGGEITLEVNTWYLIGGVFLLILVLSERWLRGAAISSAVIYMALGFILGPKVLALIELDPFGRPGVMEIVSEVVVIISLFTAGLKIHSPFRDLHWRISAILASGTMVVTVLLVAAAGYFLLKLPLPVAVILGGILAPTDPVLASEVQVSDENDKVLIRRGITGEAGLNDGTAFPVVMLGLTLLGARWNESPTPVLKWLLVDLSWAIPAGFLLGGFCGIILAKLILAIHSKRAEKLVIEDFVSIGLISASYGLAQISSAYGFLAVFAAGVMFARVEKEFEKRRDPNELDRFAPALVRFSTQLERIGELLTVTFIGYIAGGLDYTVASIATAIFLFFVFRPLAVFLCLKPFMSNQECAIISWFGIRGIGSIYYLHYAINHGLKGGEAEIVYNSVMVTIVISILAHGLSATPLMNFYLRGERARSTGVQPS